MKKSIVKIACFIGIGLAFGACVNESDFVSPVPLPDVPVQLVLHADLCPQNDTHWVELTYSKPLFKPTSYEWQSPERATVNIIEEGGRTSANLTYDKGYQRYYILNSEYSLSGGKKYTVRASATVNRVNYFNEGTTTIPSILPTNFRAEVDTFQTNSLEDRYKLRLLWTDPAQSVDYFMYKAFFLTENVDPSGIGTYVFWNRVGFTDDLEYRDDVRLNGQEIKIQDGDMPLSYFWPDPSFEPKIKNIRAILIYGNNDWYKYQIARTNDTGGDPFSNPRLSYSNCANGYGVVSGHNKITINQSY